ncbi:hypothetical protein CDAR_220791 [Caerostris darwini]|uniref:Uncharacterized protein n=1 Tax=Caerostris darwini TaxID=1538125 RepID=A0AAV4PH14_9ARAC|nr:hypothetical protein CDAR_220791 [Caerostris darwini]
MSSTNSFPINLFKQSKSTTTSTVSKHSIIREEKKKKTTRGHDARTTAGQRSGRKLSLFNGKATFTRHSLVAFVSPLTNQSRDKDYFENESPRENGENHAYFPVEEGNTTRNFSAAYVFLVRVNVFSLRINIDSDYVTNTLSDTWCFPSIPFTDG